MQAIFLVCDRIPTSMLGAYGSEWVETPNFDRFVHDAVVFDEFLPDRLASDACRWSTWTGCGANAKQNTEATSLGRKLRAAGVATAFLTDRPTAQEEAPWHADFETVASFVPPPTPEKQWATLEQLVASDLYRLPAEDHPLYLEWTSRWRMQLGRDNRLGDDAPRSLESLFAAATEWLSEHRAGDSLLWLDIGLAEADWLPPSGFRDLHLEEDASVGVLRDPMPGRVGEVYSTDDVERIRAGWADRLAYFDAMLGVFFTGVHEAGDGPRTIVFTAESGEPLGERGVVGPTTAYPYGDRSRLPLVIQSSATTGGFRTSQMFQTRDLNSLVADSLLPSNEPGLLYSTLQGRPDACRLVATVAADDARMLVARQWTYVRKPDMQELFARPEDRFHVNDLAARHPEVVEQFDRMANDYFSV